MNNGFSDWLAGFIDGEGSFIIYRKVNSGGRYINDCFTYYPKLQIAIREDDRNTLELIKKMLGAGDVSHVQRKGKYTYLKSHLDSEDQCIYYVSRKNELLALVDLLEHHPLRSKKARDFYTWALAVKEKNKNKPNRLFLQYLYEKLKYERKFGNGAFPKFTKQFMPSDISKEWVDHDRRFGLRKGSRRWLQQQNKAV